MSLNEQYFDKLSDVELRRELQKYGFTNLCVTETTRPILIKKLKQMMLHKHTQKSSNTRRSVSTLVSSTYSSVPANRTRSRQTNSAGNKLRVLPPSQNPLVNNIMPDKLIIYENDQNAMTKFDNEFYLPMNDQTGINVSGDCNYNNSNNYTSQFSNSLSNNSDLKFNTICNTSRSPKIHVPPPVLATDIHYCDNDEVEGNISNSDKESPRVVSRLLKLRNIGIKRSPVSSHMSSNSVNNNLFLSDSDSDSSSHARYIMHRSTERSILRNKFTFFNIKDKFKHSSIPFILMTSFALFFAILALLYLNKPPDMPSTIFEKSTSFTTCDDLSRSKQLSVTIKPALNCIDVEFISNAIELNRELIHLLQINNEKHFCKDRTISPTVSGADFVKYLYKKRTMDAHKILRSFHSAIYLIEQNPQWKIVILNKTNENTLLDIFEQDINFGLLKPYLSLKCILLNKIQRFFLIIGTVFLVSISTFFFYLLIHYWRKRHMCYAMAVENFINEIIKELLFRVSLKDNTGGEIIIVHLRDKLVPMNKRRTLLPAWNEALHKLETSDSRIQFGSIIKNGEDFSTLKWIDTTVHSPSKFSMLQDNNQSLRKKQWQSPAFNNVYNSFEPPTPCLKVRHMFDVSEALQPNLKENIIESILEKVGPQCKIYDIQLDLQTCCVYIRCATEADAGIVHREINGWWFDNRLVSIKFLRLQRYIARFPNSSINPITINAKI